MHDVRLVLRCINAWKEDDRMILTRYTNANIEPVFFSYKAVPEIDAIVENIVKNQEADYDFVAEDGFGHHFWAIKQVPLIYI